jgi:hypothetical protein
MSVAGARKFANSRRHMPPALESVHGQRFRPAIDGAVNFPDISISSSGLKKFSHDII